jgi:myosin heavy subunit
VTRVAALLQCDEKKLTAALTSRYLNAGGKDTLTHLNTEKAQYTRDAFAKAVYSRLFDWIVGRINQSLSTSNIKAQVINEKNTKTIGVLDIYG